MSIFNLSRFQLIWHLAIGQISAFLFAIVGLNYYSEVIGLESWAAIWNTITRVLPSWIPFVIIFGLVMSILSVGMYTILDNSSATKSNLLYPLIVLVIAGNLVLIFQLWSLWIIAPIFLFNVLLKFFAPRHWR